ncbi:MAG: LOG family protein [Candidatus Aureabacteria bacterium]|nr:LOG family protein [Candidatus Auribacterota bacterium]
MKKNPHNNKNGTNRISFVKAYRKSSFLLSKEARIIRIVSEYLEPVYRFRKYKVRNTIVFFGSARAVDEKTAKFDKKKINEKIKKSSKVDSFLLGELKQAENLEKMSCYFSAAEELAFRLTQWSNKIKDESNRFIVTSGGGSGIMTAANKGALNAKGLSIGLNISLPFEQTPNPFISSELGFEFHYFFMRKFWFLYLAKALVFFPGGFGTFDELMETLTLLQTKKINRPLPVILFGKKYWKEIIRFEKMVEWGVISPEDLDLFKFTESVEEAYHIITKELSTHYLSGNVIKPSIE